MFEDFDFQVIVNAGPILWDGMLITLLLTAVAIVGGILLGTVLALMRLSRFGLLSFVAGRYVDAFRSTPLILVIFWFYFLVPFILGFPIGDFYSVLTAFIMFEAAYYCEIIRAGIESISRGQVEGAMSVGMTYPQRMRYVVLPQAFARVAPPLLGQTAVLIKDSALVSFIGVFELFGAGLIILNERLMPNEAFLTVAACYLAIYTVMLSVTGYA